MKYDNAILVFSVLAIAFYVFSCILLLLKKCKVSYFALFSGLICNAAVFVIHWIANGYPPFANIYQILCSLSICLLIIAAVIIKINPQYDWLKIYFRFTAVIPLIGTLFMENDVEWALVPALQSPYFVPHVLSYIIGYSVAAISFLMSVRYLVYRKDREKSSDAAVTLVRVALPFMINGLTLGAIWADQIWGNFWQWDVKEVWSLITCVIYLCGLHLAGKKHNTILNILFIIGFAALIVTFLFVNILPSDGSMHVYS